MRIAPLTLLVGQNSSGKSTFARFFPLLRQTAEVLAREPLLWLGRFVDFGSADEAASKFSLGESFGADFEFMVDREKIVRRRRLLSFARRNLSPNLIPVLASIRYLLSTGQRQSYRFTLNILGHELSMEIQEMVVSQLRINMMDCASLIEGELFANTWSASFPNLIYKEGTTQEAQPFFRQIFAYARANTHGKSQADRVDQLTRALISAPLDDLLRAIKNSPAGDSIWKKTTARWQESSPDFIKLKNYIIGARLIEIVQVTASEFADYCDRIRYITPVRASAERYYRRQGLALGEIDPQGQNVAMFLHNMYPAEKKKFSLWMAKFFGNFVDTVASPGHISMVMRGSDSDKDKLSFNLADTGFGFSQMIPVLIQIWNLMSKRVTAGSGPETLPISVIAIEQPELHLHPRLQSRLADLFIHAIAAAKDSGVDLRFVVETHSEQIINRVGKRVAGRRVRCEDVSLVIFDKPSFEFPTKVTITGYDEEGLVNSWPYGFFESDDK